MYSPQSFHHAEASVAGCTLGYAPGGSLGSTQEALSGMGWGVPTCADVAPDDPM